MKIPKPIIGAMVSLIRIKVYEQMLSQFKSKIYEGSTINCVNGLIGFHGMLGDNMIRVDTQLNHLLMGMG